MGAEHLEEVAHLRRIGQALNGRVDVSGLPGIGAGELGSAFGDARRRNSPWVGSVGGEPPAWAVSPMAPNRRGGKVARRVTRDRRLVTGRPAWSPVCSRIAVFVARRLRFGARRRRSPTSLAGRGRSNGAVGGSAYVAGMGGADCGGGGPKASLSSRSRPDLVPAVRCLHVRAGGEGANNRWRRR